MRDPASNTEGHRQFYNAFLEEMMLNYRIYGNRRIEKAINRALPYVNHESCVLNIGCGIGMVAEKLAAEASGGLVWACDLSEKNIAYARRTVSEPNVVFFACDILNDFDQVEQKITKEPDVITMIDVLEHLPSGSHPILFDNLRKITAREATIVLTYPAPHYSRHVQDHAPSRLQPVDEAVDAGSLLRTAENAGFFLRHYSIEEVWRENEYVHCVLQTEAALSTFSDRPEPFASQLWRALRWRVLYPFRRWRYIDSIFDTAD